MLVHGVFRNHCSIWFGYWNQLHAISIVVSSVTIFVFDFLPVRVVFAFPSLLGLTRFVDSQVYSTGIASYSFVSGGDDRDDADDDWMNASDVSCSDTNRRPRRKG